MIIMTVVMVVTVVLIHSHAYSENLSLGLYTTGCLKNCVQCMWNSRCHTQGLNPSHLPDSQKAHLLDCALRFGLFFAIPLSTLSTKQSCGSKQSHSLAAWVSVSPWNGCWSFSCVTVPFSASHVISGKKFCIQS